MAVGTSGITVEAGKCWWCGAPADSREHRLKASDLKREYGKPPYNDLRTLTRFSGDGQHQDFRGPNSALIMFSPTLCARCNDTRSQPFDTAWDAFGTYLAANEVKVVQTRQIDWRDVFGAQWRSRGADFERYVLKHAICRVVDHLPGPIKIGGEYIDFLNGGARPSMAIELAIDFGIVGMLRATRADPPPAQPAAAEAGFLGDTDLLVLPSQADPEQWAEPHAGLYYRYMAVFWRLGPRDTTTPFDRPMLALGTTDAMFGPGFRAVFDTGLKATFRRWGLRLRQHFQRAG